MKAKFQSRSPMKDRVNLADVIPLASPITVQVEPASVCNLRCSFCPTGDAKLTKKTGKFRGLMDLGLFKKIVHDIKIFPSPISVLHLHKDGEPLMHKEFAEMVSIARSSSNIKRIETLTNGVLLNPGLNRRLAECGLDRIKISVYGLSGGGFKKNTGVGVDFDRYVENVADLYRRKKGMEIYIKIIEEGLTDDQKEFFVQTFERISDSMFFEHCVENWPGFKSGDVVPIAASAIGILGQSVLSYKKVCPQPFFNLTVCADGKVTACCADWRVKLVIGDAKESSLIELWNSDSFRDFRLMMLRGERHSHPVCGECGYPTFTCVDDIDAAVPALIDSCFK